MTKKKAPAKKKKSRLRWLWPLGIIAFLLITLAAAGYFIFLPSGIIPGPDRQPDLKTLAPSGESKKKSPIEVIKPKSNKKEVNHQRQDTASREPAGRVAIIIDDMGEQDKIGRDLIDLDIPLSFAFLPFASHTSGLLQSAKNQKRDILLHLPMEPEDGRWDPGRGALYTAMSPVRIEVTIAADLTAVPGAIGVNNHMGSRFTADRKAMIPCLAFIKRKGLFFVDSLTSNKSVAWSLAREAGLKTAKRNLFLDNRKDVKHIRKNILTLIEIAHRHGKSIGIGHPYRETLEAIRQSSEILHKRVKVVGIHELVE